MKLDYFRFRFNRDFDFVEINKNLVLSRKPKVVYDYKNNTQTKYKNFDEVLGYKFDNKTLKELIEEMTDFPEETFEGGRGARSGGKSFSLPIDEKPARIKGLPPATVNAIRKTETYGAMLDVFTQKHKNSKREYAIEVDNRGYVYEYNKGEKHKVGLRGNAKLPKGKQTTLIHNHPSGSNFSGTDLMTASRSTRFKSVVAVGNKYTYTFTKGKNFKSGAFQDAVRKANIKGDNYNDSLDKWLNRNRKKYGYSYTRVETK